MKTYNQTSFQFSLFKKESTVIKQSDIKNDTHLEGYTYVEGTSSVKITFV